MNASTMQTGMDGKYNIIDIFFNFVHKRSQIFKRFYKGLTPYGLGIGLCHGIQLKERFRK